MVELIERWDAEIAIVGAGPAGARAAELLAGLGLDVIGFDSRAPWEKPCGGGLTAAAFRTVPELAGVKPFAREIRSVRVAAIGGHTVVLTLDEPLHIVSRRDLAAWQIGRARAAGAEIVPSKITAIERTERGFRLEDDAARTFRARRLVGADGAASRVRAALTPDFRIDFEATRVTYPADHPPFAPDEVLFAFFAGGEGYLWDFPRRDHRSVGVVVTPRTWSRPRLDDEVRAYLASGGGDVAVCTPSAHGIDRLGGEDYALLGDAAGLAEPSSGEGIEPALRSAALAVEAYESAGDFSLYPSRLRAALWPEYRITRAIRRALYREGSARLVVGSARRWRPARRLLKALLDRRNAHRLGRLGPWRPG